MVFSQYECLFIKCSSYVKRKSKSLIVFNWVFPFALFRWFLLLLVPRSFLINIYIIYKPETIICILDGRGARPQKNCVYELFNFSS